MTRRSENGIARRGTEEEDELVWLMAQYQAGSADAAEELVRRLSPLLMRFLSVPRFTRSQNQDLLQECWLQIHRARHSFRPDEPLLPWLLAIGRHVRRDAWRRKTRIDSHEVTQLDAHDGTAVSSQELGYDFDLVRCLNHLPPRQREAVVMLKMSGMTLQEIAVATESSVGAVKLRIHRAYVFLRERLGTP